MSKCLSGFPKPPIVLLHGMQESATVWESWLPALAARTIFRPNLPGHGDAPAPGPDHDWSVAGLAAGVAAELSREGVGDCHLVAAKLSGAVAVELAVLVGEHIRSLTLVGAPLSTLRLEGSVDLRSNLALQAAAGTEEFLRSTQRSRLGSDASPELVAWLDGIMAGTDPAAALAVAAMAATGVDVTARLPAIAVPVLVIAAARSPLLPLATARRWVDALPDGRLHVVDSDAYHVAAARPLECARATLEFIEACESRAD